MKIWLATPINLSVFAQKNPSILVAESSALSATSEGNYSPYFFLAKRAEIQGDRQAP